MDLDLKFHTVENKGPITIWKFSNPPRNLATIGSNAELYQLVDAFDKDDDLRVAIFTSSREDVFIQHFDVSSIKDWSDAMAKTPKEQVEKHTEDLPQKELSLGARCSKPIICAINAPMAGGGCELALAFDFRFMSRTASIAQPEISAGFIPGDGGMQFIVRQVGIQRALEIGLTGRRIYADEAEELGLVLKACAPEELMPVVMAFAGVLAARSPDAVKSMKESIYRGSEMTLQEARTLDQKLFIKDIQSDWAKQAMKLYLEAGQDGKKAAEQAAKMQEES